MDVNLRNVSRLRPVRAFAILFALALALGVGFSLRHPVMAQEGQQRAALPAPADLSRAFIAVAKEVEPAVVNIDITEKPKAQTGGGFQQFQIPGFPRGFGNNAPHAERGTGSGIIISPDGFILTNNHVAGQADTMRVTLGDGREFKATRIGTDPETDLAVIKIKADSPLPFARLGNSDDVQQGEWVVALGSPFGLKQTMTAGIISAVGRSLGSNFSDYLQTDASINPGNSGGPLVNMAGEVIGVNDMIYTNSGGNEGVGFAIPANLAHKVYAELIKNGKVVRGYLGVRLQAVDQATAHVAGARKGEGALVADLANTDTPAARAGLESGDLIVEFDGKPVTSPTQLTSLVSSEPVGKTVQVKYYRDGRLMSTALKLAERPPAGELAKADENQGEGAGKLGVQVTNVGPDISSDLRIKSGAVVVSVEPGSPADNAGIEQGFVIHKINNTRVTSSADLSRAMRSLANEQEIVLQVEFDGQLRFVTVHLD